MEKKISEEKLSINDGDIIQVGKRKFAKLIFSK